MDAPVAAGAAAALPPVARLRPGSKECGRFALWCKVIFARAVHMGGTMCGQYMMVAAVALLRIHLVWVNRLTLVAMFAGDFLGIFAANAVNSKLGIR